MLADDEMPNDGIEPDIDIAIEIEPNVPSDEILDLELPDDALADEETELETSLLNGIPEVEDAREVEDHGSLSATEIPLSESDDSLAIMEIREVESLDQVAVFAEDNAGFSAEEDLPDVEAEDGAIPR